MKCYVVKDLMPNYIDSLNSKETNAEISKHLNECANCRAIYEKITVGTVQMIELGDSHINFLNKLKSFIMRKNVIIAISTCLLAIVMCACVYAYLFHYETVIPFQEEMMRIDIFQTGVSTINGGQYISHIRTPVGYQLIEGEFAINEPFLRLSNRIITYRTHIYARNKYLEGEIITLAFYSHTQTPITQLRQRIFASSLSYSKSMSGAICRWFTDDNFEPRIAVIYYLPNLHNLINSIGELSDDELAALRTNGILVWSGEIGITSELQPHYCN